MFNKNFVSISEVVGPPLYKHFGFLLTVFITFLIVNNDSNILITL